MMKILYLFFFTILSFSCVNAQTNYWIAFKDKKATQYTIDSPSDFMHPKALARRNEFNIAIDKSDLPVCKFYLDSIEIFQATILVTSKWLNGALIQVDTSSTIDTILQLPFVKSANLTFKTKNQGIHNKLNVDAQAVNTKDFDYGKANNQITMLNGQFLHNKGNQGNGIDLAVMDNGFPSVDTSSFYAEAHTEGRITAAYDFVNLNDTLFDTNNGNHGTYVVSTMAANKEGELVGTAPKANYYLFSTEDNANEGLREEYNWVFAAEMADTLLGTHAIITTSLGYSNGFNNGTENHTYADMDGNTTPITRGADFAAAKGFLVINSAGNEGDNAWKYITAPSDGDSVLCVGAVDKDRNLAAFSSRGPAADNDLKPNVCAQGKGVYGLNVSGNIVSINGTSFSCPIIAGMAACLWQAFPEKNNMEIFYAIEKSAHLYTNPNTDFGYGIPNFEEAYKILENRFEDNFKVFPNPVGQELQFFVPNNLKNKMLSLSIVSEIGATMFESQFLGENRIMNVPISFLSKGIYFVQLRYQKDKYTYKIVKL